MGASAKMDVDVSGFVKGMKEAGDSVKVINTMLKQNEAQMKLNGQSEQQMASKASLLNAKLKEQQKAAQNAEQALKAMTDAGVDPASASYQKMQMSLANAQTAMLSTELEIKNLGASSTEAAASADQLTTSVQSIGKKISLDQVINGIEKITGGMEKAARKAIDLGKAIWENIVDTARYSDDIATSAMQLDMSIEDYQRYKAVFDTVGEITVQEWMKAKQKVQKAVNDPTNDQIDIFQALGLSTKEYKDMGGSGPQLVAKNFEDMFWEIGKTLQQKVESGQMTQDLADTYANAIFGKSFASLKPMFALGKEGFTAALDEITVASEDAVKKNAELNDQLIKLQQSYDALKAETVSALAPALETAAKSIDGLLGKIMEYLKTPEGQQALTDMEKAVSGLFEDLGKISPEEVVSGFAKVFGDIVTGMQWLSDNWEGVKIGIEAIGGAFLAMKGMKNVLSIIQLINGLKGFTGAGSSAASAAATAGASAGSSWAAGFAGAVIKTIPFLAPFLLGADQIAHNQELINKGLEAGEESKQQYQTKSEQYQSSEMFSLWDTMMKYTTVNGSPEDTEKMKAFAEHYFKWFNDEITDASLDKMTEEMSDDAFDRFHDVMDRIMRGEMFYSDEDQSALLTAFKEAIEATERVMENEPVVLPTDLKVKDDAAAQISKQVGTVRISAVLDIMNTFNNGWGMYGRDVNIPMQLANGIPSVPYDGMLARLHKDEQVVPAREVLQSRNFSSNLYVESMYMNSGVDAAGLASAIAAANRRTMSGYGS